MREMITTYHTKVMSELTKIKQDVATIRSTPVEIVATHERAVTPVMSHTSQGSPAHAHSGFPFSNQQHHGTGGVLATRPAMFPSPSREVHGAPPPRSSPSFESRGEYSTRLMQGNYDSWSQSVGNTANAAGVMGDFQHPQVMRPPSIYSSNVNDRGSVRESFGDSNNQEHWPMQPMRSSSWIPAPAPPPSVTFFVRPSTQRALEYDEDEEEADPTPNATAPTNKRSRKRK